MKFEKETKILDRDEFLIADFTFKQKSILFLKELRASSTHILTQNGIITINKTTVVCQIVYNLCTKNEIFYTILHTTVLTLKKALPPHPVFG